mgnify:CR=1 FL=1
MPTEVKVEPWEWVRTSGPKGGNRSVMLQSETRRILIIKPGTIQPDEREKRLLAASPVLLAALKDLSDCGTQDHDEDYARTCSPDEPGGCALCAARAAIALVEV